MNWSPEESLFQHDAFMMNLIDSYETLDGQGPVEVFLGLNPEIDETFLSAFNTRSHNRTKSTLVFPNARDIGINYMGMNSICRSTAFCVMEMVGSRCLVSFGVDEKHERLDETFLDSTTNDPDS